MPGFWPTLSPKDIISSLMNKNKSVFQEFLYQNIESHACGKTTVLHVYYIQNIYQK